MFQRNLAQAVISHKKQPLTISKRYWQQSINDGSQKGFFQTFKGDFGNLPILVANTAAFGLILTFAGRKVCLSVFSPSL